MKIDGNGYLTRRTTASGRHVESPKEFRNWWLVKFCSTGYQGQIHVGNVLFPPQYVGKKVRFKIEVVPENEEA